MGARMLKEQTHKSDKLVGKYCHVCTPNGPVCPSTWVNCSSYSGQEESEEEEKEESDWDANIGDARGYCARTPIRRPRQTPKVLIFQSHKTPAGWAAGARPELPLKPDLVSKNEYAEPEWECNYLEPVQRNAYTEPIPVNKEVSEP